MIFFAAEEGNSKYLSCREIDECLSNPCRNGALCQDRVNGYECQCRNGYRGQNCEIAINYCEERRNQCLNGGTCHSISETASVSCECSPGYTGRLCEEDRNECELDQPCQNGAKCINLVIDCSFFRNFARFTIIKKARFCLIFSGNG